MATDIEKLVVQLSADFKSFEKALARQQGVANKQFNAIERRARQMNKNLDGIFASSFKGMAAPLAGVGAALGTVELARLADTWSDLSSRVNLATGSQEKGAETMERLGDMARATYSSLEQTTESFLANSGAIKDLGYNTDQALDYTESLNNALVVSGAKGDKAARVIDALSKAMALGKLQGDNLNTVISSGGRAAEALAAGLGTTVSGLRKLGAEGKITGRDIVSSLTSQMETLRKEAEAMPATISDGFQLLNNALLQYVGNADTATGISGKIAEALVIIADNFDKVADAGLQVAAVLAGGLLGRSIAGMIANLGLGITALNNFRKALAAAQTMGGLATALGGLSAAAGPLGMIIGGAVVGSLILYNNTVGQSSEGATLFAARLKEVEEAAKNSGDAVEEAGKKNSSYNLNSIKAEVAAGTKEFERAKDAVRDLLDGVLENAGALKVVKDEFGNVSRQPLASPEQYRQLQTLRDELNKNSDRAEHVKKALQDLANSNPNFQALADQLNPLLDKLINVAKAARLANAELADKTTSRGRSAKDDAIPIDLNKIAAESYEKEAMRKASLNKKEHTLELERIKVRNDAMKDGTKLTEEAIDRIAEANIAADAARSAEGKKPKKEKQAKTPKTEDDYFFQITQQVKDRTAALAEEAKITGLTFLEQEKRRTALELEQDVLSRLREEARKKGDKDWESVKLSPAQVSSINAVSEAYARQADELRKVQEAQSDSERAAAEFYDTFNSGMVGALTGANSLQDALSGILKKLAEMILNSAFDTLFGGVNASRSGGWLTGAMKAIGFADGGLPQFANGTPSRLRPGLIHGPGTGRSDSIVARVSNKEFITNARSTAKHRGLLEAINEDRLPAYMDGTPSLRAPTMPILKAGNSNEQGGMKFAPVYHIDARGADQAAVSRLEAGLAKTNREMESRVIQTMRKAQKSNVRF